MNYNPDKTYGFLRGSINVYELISKPNAAKCLIQGHGYLVPTEVAPSNFYVLPKNVIKHLAHETINIGAL